MSYVTTVMLSVAYADEESIPDFNHLVATRTNRADTPWYYSVQCLTGDPNEFGGSKIPHAAVYGGGFNHLPLQTYLECVAEYPWSCSEDVQLFVKDEDDQRFTVYSYKDVVELVNDSRDR